MMLSHLTLLKAILSDFARHNPIITVKANRFKLYKNLKILQTVILNLGHDLIRNHWIYAIISTKDPAVSKYFPTKKLKNMIVYKFNTMIFTTESSMKANEINSLFIS